MMFVSVDNGTGPRIFLDENEGLKKKSALAWRFSKHLRKSCKNKKMPSRKNKSRGKHKSKGKSKWPPVHALPSNDFNFMNPQPQPFGLAQMQNQQTQQQQQMLNNMFPQQQQQQQQQPQAQVQPMNMNFQNRPSEPLFQKFLREQEQLQQRKARRRLKSKKAEPDARKASETTSSDTPTRYSQHQQSIE